MQMRFYDKEGTTKECRWRKIKEIVCNYGNEVARPIEICYFVFNAFGAFCIAVVNE